MFANLLRVAGCLVGQPTFLAPAADMSAKTAVVTGPSIGGIGFETALALARFGARVIVGARNPTSAAQSIEAIREQVPECDVQFAPCDLSKLSSVNEFAQSVNRIANGAVDVLVCNAGAHFDDLQKTEEGVENTFAVCALGHHKLIHDIAPHRTVWVSGDIYALSNGLPDPYLEHGGQQAYMKACLARLLLTRELKCRNEARGVDTEIVCLHPGVISTEFVKTNLIMKSLFEKILISPMHGAQASIYAATAPRSELHQDSPLPYYHNKRKWVNLPEDDLAMNKEAGRKLFDDCDRICGITRV